MMKSYLIATVLLVFASILQAASAETINCFADDGNRQVVSSPCASGVCIAYNHTCTATDTYCYADEQAALVEKRTYLCGDQTFCDSLKQYPEYNRNVICCTTNNCNDPAFDIPAAAPIAAPAFVRTCFASGTSSIDSLQCQSASDSCAAYSYTCTANTGGCTAQEISSGVTKRMYGCTPQSGCDSIVSTPMYQNAYCCSTNDCNNPSLETNLIGCYATDLRDLSLATVSQRTCEPKFNRCVAYGVQCSVNIGCSSAEIQNGVIKRVYGCIEDTVCPSVVSEPQYQNAYCCDTKNCNNPALESPAPSEAPVAVPVAAPVEAPMAAPVEVPVAAPREASNTAPSEKAPEGAAPASVVVSAALFGIVSICTMLVL